MADAAGRGNGMTREIMNVARGLAGGRLKLQQEDGKSTGPGASVAPGSNAG